LQEDLLARRVPQSAEGDVTLKEICNKFLTSKQRKVTTGERSLRTFLDYKETCALLLTELGNKIMVKNLRPIDFEEFRYSMAKRFGPVRLGKKWCGSSLCSSMRSATN
jgi:hypothetical protein